MAGRKNQEGLPAAEEVNAFLGKEACLEGKMSFKGIFHIDGKYDGEVLSGDSLVIGNKAEVNAKIDVNNLIVMGKVRGNIKADNRIEIHPSGELQGNIQTSALIIMEGAIFEGKCQMGKKEIKGHEKVSSHKVKEKERTKT